MSKICRLTTLLFLLTGCSPANDDAIPLVIYVNGHSMSKLPFVIAQELGLYRKYGLDVEFQMPPPEFDAAIIPRAPLLLRVQRRLGLIQRPLPAIVVTGHTPTIYNQVNLLDARQQVALAATDCSVRYYIVAQPGIESLEEIRGKRIGINRMGTTSAFAAMRLIERMGWDRQFDVSVLERTRGIEDLELDRAEVIVGGDEIYEQARRHGYSILADTRSWHDALAGNSVLVDVGWLDQGNNRDAARRFLQAVIEGLAVFHQEPERAVDIAYRWYGFPDREFAWARLDRADYVTRTPFPCYTGIENTMQVHDSHAMRQHRAADFFDDSLIRELSDSGFIDSVYRR